MSVFPGHVPGGKRVTFGFDSPLVRILGGIFGAENAVNIMSFGTRAAQNTANTSVFGKQKSRNFVNTMSFWTRAVQNTANISVLANFPPASSCTKHRHLWSRKCRKYHEFWDSSCTKHRKYQCFCKQKSRKCCKYYEFWDLSCTKHRKYQCFYK